MERMLHRGYHTKVGGLIAAGSHGDVTARAAFTVENGQRLADY